MLRAGDGHLWKLVRTFDDPATWTTPGAAQQTADGERTETLPDHYELYDLEADPIEADNRWRDPDAAERFDELRAALDTERNRSVPSRNEPWPYVAVRREPGH